MLSDDYFAFPFGISSDNAVRYLEQSDVHLAFSYNNNINMLPSDNRYELPRYLIFNHMPFVYFKWMVK